MPPGSQFSAASSSATNALDNQLALIFHDA